MRPPSPARLAKSSSGSRNRLAKLRSFRENACQTRNFFRPAARRLRIQGCKNLGDDSFQEGRFKSSAVTIAPAAAKSDGDVLDAGRKWSSERMVDSQFYFSPEPRAREAQFVHPLSWRLRRRQKTPPALQLTMAARRSAQADTEHQKVVDSSRGHFEAFLGKPEKRASCGGERRLRSFHSSAKETKSESPSLPRTWNSPPLGGEPAGFTPDRT